MYLLTFSYLSYLLSTTFSDNVPLFSQYDYFQGMVFVTWFIQVFVFLPTVCNVFTYINLTPSHSLTMNELFLPRKKNDECELSVQEDLLLLNLQKMQVTFKI